ncbi:hypothetical protein ANN_01185 [Periplaneta americana]|uniref:Uncharacterized protein n=1 Tax=Periplaneta americana TaxID=6978 RepID=A0ABQ8TUJ3_PERAM|nr:hypothetical protein ANN_01185 [Periplaneta americana]
MHQTIIPAIRELYGDEKFYLQEDDTPTYYHRDVRAPLYLWETLKDVVYREKSAALDALREQIEMSCAAITLLTLQNIVRGAVPWHLQYLAADGGHFIKVQFPQQR